MNESKKIFISHSSKDIAIVEPFIDKILRNGIGFKNDEIYCTSIESMGISNGDDMRKHIENNIKSCCCAILLISCNYKQSEICLNEMGAVWVYGVRVYTFILPDINFTSIGWLMEVKKANMINDKSSLCDLFDNLSLLRSERQKFSEWQRQLDSFIENLTQKITTPVGSGIKEQNKKPHEDLHGLDLAISALITENRKKEARKKWDEVNAKLGYVDARKQHPDIYNEFMATNSK